jgi:hypothetical protein
MSLTAGDVECIHGLFGGVDELLTRRRAIYRLSVELARGAPDETDPPIDVLDNPTVRAHLADVLAGISAYDSSRMSRLSRFVEPSARVDVAGHQVRLASTPDAALALEGALRHIDAALVRGTNSPLVLEGSQQFTAVVRTLTGGIELAVSVAPELALDLLPHVALFAVVDSEYSGQLGSASLREFPGLILLPEPRSSVEVAEALIHEGAHQKFFDLAMTQSVLDPLTRLRYAPPWRPSDAPRWPFEQCVAAFHAYSCLAAFDVALRNAPEIALHSDSLLPFAADRAEVLGSWLLDHREFLGPDGQKLVARLIGAEFDEPPAPTGVDDLMSELSASSEPVVVQRCGEWTLIMQLTRPAVLLWVRSATVDLDVLAVDGRSGVVGPQNEPRSSPLGARV